MSAKNAFIRELQIELATTRDQDTQRVFSTAIADGPRSQAWSDAVTILGLRESSRRAHERVGVAPDAYWESRVFDTIAKQKRRATIRIYAVAILAGACLGGGGALMLWMVLS